MTLVSWVKSNMTILQKDDRENLCGEATKRRRKMTLKEKEKKIWKTKHGEM